MRVKRHILILFTAIIAAFLICDFTGNVSQNLIREVYSTLVGKENKGGIKIILDDFGVPIVDYGIYIGRQRNPVTVSNKALNYYECYEKGSEKYLHLFLNCSDWLVNNSVACENYAVLEYGFPWPEYDMTPPWRSGMAQGKALQVLVRAHNATNDEKYVDCAKNLLNLFFIDVEKGGVTYKTQSDGWWYEEYSDERGKKPRVLNGMIAAVLGIYEYYVYTKDSDAKYLFDQGLLGLKKSLHKYDNNGYSYYDILKNPAGRYHNVHVQLLDRLYDITNEEIFKKYHNRWGRYKESKEPPFIVQLIQDPTKMEFAIFVLNLFVVLLTLEIIIFAVQKRRMRK